MLNFIIGCAILAFCLYVGMFVLSILWTVFMLAVGAVFGIIEAVYDRIKR